jgi:putative membrane protein
VADHTKANSQLMSLAQQKGVKLDSKQPKMSKLDKGNFDQAWLAEMVKDHQKDIQAFESASKNASDPEVKTFAKNTLPVLQKHLRAVKTAQQKMGGSGDSTAATKKS